MDRSKVDNILWEIGIPANVNGFDYIGDAMDVFEESGFRISVTKILYPEIAKRNNSTPTRVERAIRHALEIANSTRGDCENFEKYVGFINTTNSAALISLYKHIKKEENMAEGDACKTDVKGISPELELLIREIVRDEMKRIVSG